MSKIEGLLRLQKDFSSRILKATINFKKSPKERITEGYVENRLQLLEELWSDFRKGHKNLLLQCDSTLLDEDSYITSDVYQNTEDEFMMHKTELKLALAKFGEPKSNQTKPPNTNTSYIKLPKINIPIFSGNYAEWTTFQELFNLLIIKNETLDNVQRMHYLKGHLSGEAEQLLRHIPTQEANFVRCWELLSKRYNNKRLISNNVLKRLLSQRNLASESASGLKSLVDTTNDCLATITNLGINTSGWDILLIHILSLKLDTETRRQWEFSISDSSDEFPTYVEFAEFLTNRYRAIECLGTKPTVGQNQFTQAKSMHVKNIDDTECPYCQLNHKLTVCNEFRKEDVNNRRQFVLESNICFNCMGSNHCAKDCHSKIKCRICKRQHHVLLHPRGSDNYGVGDNEASECAVTSAENANNAETSPLVSCFSTDRAQKQVLLATALVKAVSKSGQGCNVRALIDQGSQSSFITESTVRYLGLKKIVTKGQITSLGGDKNIISKAMVSMEIQSRYDPNVIIPVKAYVLKNITSLLPSRRVEVEMWEEVKDLPLADPKYHTPNRIDLLLGAEVYCQILQAGMKKNSTGTLVAQSTNVGWILSGVVTSAANSSLNIQVLHCCAEDKQREKVFERRHWDQHFIEPSRRQHSGRYNVCLPFRNRIPEVGITLNQLGGCSSNKGRQFAPTQKDVWHNDCYPSLRGKIVKSSNH